MLLISHQLGQKTVFTESASTSTGHAGKRWWIPDTEAKEKQKTWQVVALNCSGSELECCFHTTV